ncbi:hypothetical protein BON22_1084 [Cyberlindnera fabianii]|nr:hypothetical protein BON22_1084 [Cyberlindnera fabianii]
MRPSSNRRLSGKFDDIMGLRPSPRRETLTAPPQADYDPTLPSYAQSTIAFSQHTLKSNGKGTARVVSGHGTLRAGTARAASRPTSKRGAYDIRARAEVVIADAKHSPSTPLKKRPSFVNIFRGSAVDSPETDDGNLSEGDKSAFSFVWRRSPGYRSPRLIQNSTSKSIRANRAASDYMDPPVKLSHSGTVDMGLTDEDDRLNKLFQEVEVLLKEVLMNADETLQSEYTPDQLKNLVSQKKSIDVEDWNGLADYHVKLCEKYQKKLDTDYRLIEKVLKVNDELSKKCNAYSIELKKLREQVALMSVQKQFASNGAETDSAALTDVSGFQTSLSPNVIDDDCETVSSGNSVIKDEIEPVSTGSKVTPTDPYTRVFQNLNAPSLF